MEITTRPETLTTNLETELHQYAVMTAADVVAGKVTEVDVFVITLMKREPEMIEIIRI